ncbi:hypothetical protein BKA58DRAFT_471627 [Alternaria rosae]|uniref:uncharacterized protein n=1 Tax=Alternaria rosae TaxID=1187941 RepID=UPI001E8E94EC|nr:uncharacterized protein BKA58DRAFT_471627 [Alternaria rosae]KAH6865679.1 hypothetical protein BKA58DRAFT_471627 [Alternaria rosae]
MAALSNMTTSPVAKNFDSPYDASYPHHSITPAHDTTHGLKSIQAMEPVMAAGDPLPPLFFSQQNQAISDFLRRGIHPDEFLQMIQNFKIAVWTGNFRDLATMAVSGNFNGLAIMAEIPTEVLDKRIEDVVYTPIPSIVEKGPNIKREPSDESLEYPATRALKAPKGIEPKLKGKRKNKPTVNVYGCVGNGGKCQMRKHRYWRSKKEFGTHFETHLKEYQTPDGFICEACEKCKLSPGIVSIVTKSFSHFRDLVTHTWNEHMVPSTTSKPTEGTAVVVEDELGEPSSIQYKKMGDTKLEGGNGPGESSGTLHGQAGGTGSEFFDMSLNSLPDDIQMYLPGGSFW